jgi:hypothetical protein
MPQIAKRPFMGAHNGHVLHPRQGICEKFRGFGRPNLAYALALPATKSLLDR